MKKISLIEKLYFYFKFLKRNHYFPNLYNPQTFNEKTNYRKYFSDNSLFTLCSDKVEVKNYVKERIGEKYITKTLFTTEKLQVSDVENHLKEHDSFVVKASHNSGHVYFVDNNTSKEKIRFLCADLNKQLLKDFGKRRREYWYSNIKPLILFEENICPGELGDLTDYKFHVFSRNDKNPVVILCAIFERGRNPHASFFDEQLNWIPMAQGYPCIKTRIDEPKNYKEMLRIVKQLAEPFNYVRVDLYNNNGDIRFGEFTFADGSGYDKFSSIDHDLWLGNIWQGDICN